jgi:hypothetical protein
MENVLFMEQVATFIYGRMNKSERTTWVLRQAGGRANLELYASIQVQC